MQAYDKVQQARSTSRPIASDYIRTIFKGFFELHGDRCYGDDGAILGGIAYLGRTPLTVIGIEKGGSIEEKVARNFGSAHPEGYRKAMRLMNQAEKFGRPVICFVDTSGAYCGIEAEERGQGSAIAQSLIGMSRLSVPVISVVIGEGGSGGALAVAVANEIWMLENSVFSVISPEGAASILYKDASKAKEASEDLKLTAQDLLGLGIIDRIFSEHGGDFGRVFGEIRANLEAALSEYRRMSPEQITRQRYDKFRGIGRTRE